jgi:hypothetical protein
MKMEKSSINIEENEEMVYLISREENKEIKDKFGDKKIRLYDPHPGLAGAIVRLPKNMKSIVDELNGKSMTLNEVIGMLDPIAKHLDGKIGLHSDYIGFKFKSGPLIHSYKLWGYELIK